MYPTQSYIKSSFKKVFFKWLVNICFLLFGFQVIAQQSAVQVTTQFIPPYSLKLSDYNTAANEKLFVQLLLTDIAEVNRSVRLRMYIEGSGVAIQSIDFPSGETPLFLDGGFPLRLSNIDLGYLFKLENLQGISPDTYNKPLPEGLYQFCFEVYDAVSHVRLSQKSCTPLYLVQNDPPLLNLPTRGEIVTQKNTQNIIFQWTPRHLNATNIEYEFTLKELWDNYADPQAAFLSSAALYQTTSFAPTLLYDEGKPQLLPNKRYAWQVRAISKTDGSENAVFKNKGYSEVFHFIYTADCSVPQFLLSEAQSTTKVKVMWQADADQIKFNIQYRKKDVKNAVWFERPVQNKQESNLYSLQADTWYEFRVGSSCISDFTANELLYSYSEIQEFKTPKKGENSTYNCGYVPNIVITNAEPLQSLGTNELFTAGDFPVTVKEINADSGGNFTGWGYIEVPYLADTKIKVSFTNIKINTDFQLIQGVVFTTYDPNWSNVDDIQDEIDVVVDAVDDISDIIDDVFGDNSGTDESDDDTSDDDTPDDDTSDDDTSDDDTSDDDTSDDDTSDDDTSDDDTSDDDTPVGVTPDDTLDDTPDDEDTDRIAIFYNRTEYRQGDTINVIYDENKKITLKLINTKKDSKVYWSSHKDMDIVEASKSLGQDKKIISFSISSLNNDFVAIEAAYWSPASDYPKGKPFRLRVQLNIIQEEFEFIELYAVHKEERLAKSGKPLYLIKNSKGKKIKYGAQVLRSKLTSNKIKKKNLTWTHDQTHVPEYDGKRNFKSLLKKRKEPYITSVRTGFPDVKVKKVKVEWVNRDYKKETLLSFTKQNKFTKLINTTKKVANTLKLPIYTDKNLYDGANDEFSIFLNLAHTKETENKEDLKSRLVYKETKKKLLIKAGIKGKTEFPIPYLSIPPFEKKILHVKVKFKLGVFFYIKGGAYGELGITKYDLKYIEEGNKHNKTYEKVGDPSMLKIDAGIGLDPKAVFTVGDNFGARISGEIGVYAILLKADFTPGGRTYSPLFEEGFDLVCKPVASVYIFGKWRYSPPIGEYRYQVKW